jgi:hypothetical protein
MIDTKDGVFFRSMLSEKEGKRMSPQSKSYDGCHSKDTSKSQSLSPLRSLVEPADRVFATEYAYFVMAQMTTCTFTESDRLGKRKGYEARTVKLISNYSYI